MSKSVTDTSTPENEDNISEKFLMQQEGINRLADAFIASAHRWEMIIYPLVFVFIVIASIGFYLIYGLTKDIVHITDNMIIIGSAFDTGNENAAMILMTKDIKHMSHDLSNMTQRIDKMENNISTMTGSITGMGTDIHSMEGKITSMDQSLKVVSGNVMILTQSIQQITGNIGSLNHNVSRPLSIMNKMIPFR